MAHKLLYVILTLTTTFHKTLAGNQVGKAIGGSCQPKTPEPPVAGACVGQPQRQQRWACEDPRLQFPTVACLTADILLCGKVKDNWCVFYSFGALGYHARNYAAKDLIGRGITIHGAFDGKYEERVLAQKRFHLDDRNPNAQNLVRESIYVRRLSQAFASVCKDKAYLMIDRRDGLGGGGPGIFQAPWFPDNRPGADRQDNVWLNDEMPALQLNDKIN